MYNKPPRQNIASIPIPRITTIQSEPLIVPSQPLVRNLTEEEEKIEQRKRVTNIISANVTTKKIPPISYSFYAWFDASDPESMDITPEGNVTKWYDKGLRDNDLIPQVVDVPIPYGTREHAGKHVMDFNGLNYAFTRYNFEMLTTSHSWFVVAKVDERAMGNAHSVISFLGESATIAASWQLRGNTILPFPQWSGLVVRSQGETAIEVNFHIPPVDSRELYYLYEVVFDRTNNTVSTYLNGTFVESKQDNEAFSGTGKFSLGCNRASSEFIDGAIAEVICLDSSDMTKRQIVQNYLLTKWML